MSLVRIITGCALAVAATASSGAFADKAHKSDSEQLSKLPTYAQMMKLSPVERKEYLKGLQEILAFTGGLSPYLPFPLVTDNRSEPELEAKSNRYSEVLALLHGLTFPNAQADSPAAQAFDKQVREDEKETGVSPDRGCRRANYGDKFKKGWIFGSWNDYEIWPKEDHTP